MAEFELIERYCHGIGSDHKETILGVGDDAAVVSIPSGFELAISVDTMVSGVHFFHDVSPAKLAHKLLAVNLSDMAAMGAEAKWATIALTQPNLDETWLSEFMRSTDLYAKRNGVQLIGGDSTQGPLTLTMQIMGLVPQGQSLTRSGAKSGDDVYVSGELGDAALALSLINAGSQDISQVLLDKLERPEPQLALGQELLRLASACIDVSDGLLADLKHVANLSGVSIHIELNKLPVSSLYEAHLKHTGNYDFALAGGDDYQLAFSANQSQRTNLAAVSQRLGVELTRVGKVVTADSPQVLAFMDGQPYRLDGGEGYQHFRSLNE